MSTKLIREKHFEIKPFKSVVFGDEWYREQGRKDLVYDVAKMSYENPRAAAVVREVEVTEKTEYSKKPITFGSIEVLITLYQNDRQGQFYKTVFEHGLAVPKDITKRIDIGCDTASFFFALDRRGEEINTGADGYVGAVIKYKSATCIEFSLTTDYYNFDEVCQMVRYFCDKPLSETDMNYVITAEHNGEEQIYPFKDRKELSTLLVCGFPSIPDRNDEIVSVRDGDKVTKYDNLPFTQFILKDIAQDQPSL